MSECQVCGTQIACDCDDDLVLSGWWIVLAATAFFAIGIGVGQIIKV